ncbi:MAG: hypothetical protein HY654_01335 [Acidobacteria bacterium]|nr:hypothetical protein [Acidobacteriota bacterium]
MHALQDTGARPYACVEVTRRPMETVVRLAAAVFVLALVGYLGEAWVTITRWSSGTPELVARFPTASHFWTQLAAAAGLVAVSLAVWRQRYRRTAQDFARRLTPIFWLTVLILPYVPWVNERLPLVLLLSGPARWGVIAFVAIATASAFLTDRVGIAVSELGRARVFAISLAIFVACGTYAHRAAGLQGDEPHYLVIAQSLLKDGDLRIENQHSRREYRSFVDRDLPPHFLRRGANGEIYSVHAPGLPVLLLPAFAVAGKYGAMAFMCLLSAMTASIMFDVAQRIAGHRAAVSAWVLTAFSSPFLQQSWLIFPEMAAAAIGALAMRWLLDERDAAPIEWLWRGLALAILPWLHTKFVVILAVLVVAFAIRLRRQVWSLCLLSATIAVALGLWLLFFYLVYGVVDPAAPYGSSRQAGLTLANVPRGVLGLLMDGQYGLLTYSPIYALAPIGFLFLVRLPQHRWFAATLAMTAILFIVSTTRFYMWWGGWSVPARFLVPVLPMSAAALALTFRRLEGRGLLPPLVLATLISAPVLVAAGNSDRIPIASERWGDATGAHQAAEILRRALPTFIPPHWQGQLPVAALWVFMAGTSLAAPYFLRRRWPGMSSLECAAASGTALLIVAGALTPAIIDASGRNEIARQGPLGVLRTYDHADGLIVDYARLRTLTPADLLTRMATRLQLSPRTIVPEREGSDDRLEGVEAVPDYPGAHIIYRDRNVFPERGAFWTHGGQSTRILVVTANAAKLILHVSAGASSGRVDVSIDGKPVPLELERWAERPIEVPLSESTKIVPIEVRSPGGFRPADAVPSSNDRRWLGCRVRIELIPPADRRPAAR